MILLNIFTSFIGTLLSGLLGKYIGEKWTKWLVTLSIFISLISVYIIYIDIMFKDIEYTYNFLSWINIQYINIDWSFTLDKLSISMLIPVVTVSCLVHLYSCSYMSHDPHQQRFFSYLSLFTFSMIVLVTGNNYLILFLGWEFIGVTSYLLISFWYTRITAAKSGLSALLINRFGDAFLVIGISYLLINTGSLNYDTIFALSSNVNNDILIIILICFVIAATAKSAQLGLHSWLLLAMEGPTPVSSLLHAACLVIAGVFLLMRSSPLLEYCPIVLLIILWLGGLSTLISGLIATVSNDIKRIIALSTMSQVGIMMIAIGVSNYNLALYHLICHSFFKALLFMSAGSVIHSILSENQDIRIYGGFKAYLPLTYTCMLIASLSLMAIPSLTGYYSKDIIIESMYGKYEFNGFINYIFALTSATLTSLYSIRLLYYTFLSYPNNSKNIYIYLKENDIVLLLPMIILTIYAIFSGYLLKDIYLGLGSPFNDLFIHPNNLSIIDTEFGLSTLIKILPLILGLSLSIILIFIYEFNYSLLFVYNNNIFKDIYTFFNQKIMFDQLLNNYIIRFGLFIGWLLNVYIDRGLLKYIGPLGISKLLNNISLIFNKLLFFNFGLLLELIVLTWLFIIINPSYLIPISLFILLFIFKYSNNK